MAPEGTALFLSMDSVVTVLIYTYCTYRPLWHPRERHCSSVYITAESVPIYYVECQCNISREGNKEWTTLTIDTRTEGCPTNDVKDEVTNDVRSAALNDVKDEVTNDVRSAALNDVKDEVVNDVRSTE
jgi:hypothetical protein